MAVVARLRSPIRGPYRPRVMGLSVFWLSPSVVEEVTPPTARGCLWPWVVRAGLVELGARFRLHSSQVHLLQLGILRPPLYFSRLEAVAVTEALEKP